LRSRLSLMERRKRESKSGMRRSNGVEAGWPTWCILVGCRVLRGFDAQKTPKRRRKMPEVQRLESRSEAAVVQDHDFKKVQT